MKALIILAHGSRRQGSTQEIVTLVDKVRKIAAKEYHSIEHAYLEIAEPDLPLSIKQLVDNGVSDITVLPYFLNSANHVKRDIPALILKQARSA